MTALTKQEVLLIVNRYIGTSGGYLGDFSYRTHEDFYPEFCGLDIKPGEYPGTTRERFIAILEAAPPDVQAKIVRGVMARFPVDVEKRPPTRTHELAAQLYAISDRLAGVPAVSTPTPRITSAVVQQAIADAQTMIGNGRPVSAVDRVHTALHGYLRAVCNHAGIPYGSTDGMARLLKLIRQQHPAFQNLGPRAQDIERILQSFAQVMDALNSIRNNASVAHPNEQLLDSDEAVLAINAASTILHYLDRKLK